MSTDHLRKFMFENAGVRGEMVELSETWQHVRERHNYPPAIETLLGQLLAAAALLSANLKFDGTMILQLHGDGPVRLLVAECNSQLRMRGTAKLAPDALIPDDASLSSLVNLHGKGRFVITLDPKHRDLGQQAYQGMVPLEGHDIASVLEHYMLRSEQLDTKLYLAADTHVVRGLLLQKLPLNGGIQSHDPDVDTWQRAVMLADTLHTPELLTTPTEVLMQRLFWEETIRAFEPQSTQFHCTCSREKVGDMLKMLGREEIDSALAEMGTLSINCDFCGLQYSFDPVDCMQLFTDDAPVETLLPIGEMKH